MKFLYIFFAFFAVINFKASAQTTPPASKTKDPDSYVKSYIGIFGGISSPLKDFKNATYEDYKSGFAKRGVTFGFDGAVYIYRNLAIGAMASFQDQGELTTADITTIATGYSESYKADGAYSSAVGRYHSYNALIGPQYSIPFYKNFIIDLRAFGGALITHTTPSYTTLLTASTTQGNVTFYQNGGKGTSFSYGGSAALRYKLGDAISFVIKGNYIQSNGPKIGYTNLNYVSGRYVDRQPFTVIQTTLGMNISF